MSVLILKDFRDKYGVDRDAQAEMLNISIDTLNNWEYRTKKIPKSKLKNIEYVFSMYKKDKVGNKEIKENPLNTRIEVLETTVKSLKDNLKMVYDQLLFLQNSWIAEKNNKNNNEKLG